MNEEVLYFLTEDGDIVGGDINPEDYEETVISENSSKAMCIATGPGGCFCTRPKGHTGHHVGHGYEKTERGSAVGSVWTQRYKPTAMDHIMLAMHIAETSQESE